MKPLNRGHRFPPASISHAVWLFHRFTLNLRDVEDLLAERDVSVSYEAVRLWCRKFGPAYARNLPCRQGRLGDVWRLDEVFIMIRAERHCLWRAVDPDGDSLDILVTHRRDARAGKRFFRKFWKGQGGSAWQIVTDKLGSYAAAHRDLGLTAALRTGRYEKNRAEVSHQPSRERERHMRRFKPAGQAQRFLAVHTAAGYTFRVARHRLKAIRSRLCREQAFHAWDWATYVS